MLILRGQVGTWRRRFQPAMPTGGAMMRKPARFSLDRAGCVRAGAKMPRRYALRAGKLGFVMGLRCRGRRYKKPAWACRGMRRQAQFNGRHDWTADDFEGPSPSGHFILSNARRLLWARLAPTVAGGVCCHKSAGGK